MAMDASDSKRLDIVVFVTPHFNVATTMSFIDPFRVANYLSGGVQFTWSFVSEAGGLVEASNGLPIQTVSLSSIGARDPWLVVISTSWSPEQNVSRALLGHLNKWKSSGAIIGGLDTGAFVLAKAGFLNGKTATVHYEHIDALIETAPDTTVSENMFVLEDRLFTCCGGTASTDLALRFVHSAVGNSLANASARYLFHHTVRGEDSSQNPKSIEPMGYVTSSVVRDAVDCMEANLETPLPIPEIARKLGVSQRQLGRLFNHYVHKSPVAYYRDIRLDRARGLVTQTEMRLSEIAVASGFNSQVHFSRAYAQRFGLSPSADRIEGRVPFEFRAWPMFNPGIKTEGSA